MAREIVLPQWGMEMQDATIVKWLKQEGDPVRSGAWHGPQGQNPDRRCGTSACSPGQPAAQPTQVVPIRGIRQTIATRMLQSLQTLAQVTLTTEIDVTDAMQLRDGLAH